MRNGLRTIGNIRIGTRSYKYNRRDTAKSAGALQLAKESAIPVRCECCDASPRLSVHRSSRADGDRFWLATWPKGGPAHSPECPFHRPVDSDAANRSARLAAIQILPSGFSIKGNISLSRALQPDNPPPNRGGRTGHSDAASASSTSLLGILEFLMERAQLHRHEPGTKRRWVDVAPLLAKALDGGLLGREPLPELTYVVPQFSYPGFVQAAHFRAFRQSFLQDPAVVPRFLMLSEFTGMQLADDGSLKAGVGQLSGGVPLSDSLKDRLQRKYAMALAKPLPPKHTHVMGLFLVEVLDSDRMLAVDAALLLTSRAYVPCDSSHEVRMANLLIQKKRHFEKPMRSPFPNSKMVPDFLLRDTSPWTPVEVWGMTTEEYLAHKAAKRAEYKALGLTLVEWEAHSGAALPMAEIDATLSRAPGSAL